MSFTYGQLKQAVQDYTENYETTFVNNIPVFIRLAEDKILKQVQLNLFRKTQTSNFVVASKYLNLPTDFLAPYSLSFVKDGEKHYLEFKDASFVQTYSPDPSVQGDPKYYGQFDNVNFILGPTPGTAYPFELSYYYAPISLTVDSGGDDSTSWLSINAETTLLYATLVEAGVFMKAENDTMAMYMQRVQEGLAQLKQLGEAKQTTDLYRTGTVIRSKQ
jgi:hypothetical protein